MIILRRYLDKSTSKREISNIILFSLGKLISLFGTYIYTFAIGLYVLKLTGSSLSFATTLAFSILPMVVVNPIAGVLADKLNRKILAVSMDLLNGILFLALYFLSSKYGLNLTMIYLTTFTMTSCMTIFDVSMESAKPNMVSEGKLMRINSISTIIYSITRILGPMIGGIVFALIDIELFIVLNGVSFILSGISEVFIDFRFNNPEVKDMEETKKINFIEDVVQGCRYLLEKKEIVSLLIIFVFLNFSTGLSLSVPLPFIINNVLKLSSKYLGIIQSAFPLGLIIGAVFVEKVSKRFPYKKLLIMMNLVIAIGIFFTGIPVLPFRIIKEPVDLLIYYSVIMFIMGIAMSFIDVPIISILQKSISDEYRGRVLSLTFSLVKIALPLAFIFSGILIKILPIYMLQVIGSSILIISSIVSIKDKGRIN